MSEELASIEGREIDIDEEPLDLTADDLEEGPITEVSEGDESSDSPDELIEPSETQSDLDSEPEESSESEPTTGVDALEPCVRHKRHEASIGFDRCPLFYEHLPENL